MNETIFADGPKFCSHILHILCLHPFVTRVGILFFLWRIIFMKNYLNISLINSRLTNQNFTLNAVRLLDGSQVLWRSLFCEISFSLLNYWGRGCQFCAKDSRLDALREERRYSLIEKLLVHLCTSTTFHFYSIFIVSDWSLAPRRRIELILRSISCHVITSWKPY